MTLDKNDIAQALREIATLLELQRIPSFKVQAYVKGARAIEAAQQDIASFVEHQTLTSLPGIGDSLAAIITELHTTERSMLLERLRAELPRGARELSKVTSLEQIKKLDEALGVTTLAELEAACVAGRVRDVKGFGEKTEAKLLEKVRAALNASPALELAMGLALANELCDALRGALGPELHDLEVVGAARRGEDVVTELELLALADDPRRVAEALARLSRVRDVVVPESAGPMSSALVTSIDGRLDDGMALRVHVALPEHAGSARFRTIGPPEHVAVIERALAGGADAASLHVTSRLYMSEEELYADAGRVVVPPELRDDPDAASLALRGSFRLLEASDIQGMIHCHTTWSDGRHSVADMVRAAEALGMRYLTITDHSPTAGYANGVGLDRLYQQWDEIARVQETTRVRILRGCESDILADGGLDYPDEVLAQLDVVIVSIHNRHSQDEADMTRRLVRAMRHPIKKIWGHPLGRLLMRRPPVACRMEEILDAIVDSGTIVELNGDPHRMDLAPEWARVARRRDIRFVASVDAHATHEMKYLTGAVTLARRAGLGPAQVLNTLDTAAFMAAVKPAA